MVNEGNLMNASNITGGSRPFGQIEIQHTRTAAEVLDQTEVLHRQSRKLHVDTKYLRRQGILNDLADRQNAVAAMSGSQLLDALADAGFSWRDIARLSHVTVPAVQKWRRGQGITGPNRHRLAKVVALLDMLATHFIHEAVSWLEMPVKEGVALSRMDLLVADRYDLVLELSSEDGNLSIIDEILDEYQPDWRDTLVDNQFETFVAADGVVSIRPKG